MPRTRASLLAPLALALAACAHAPTQEQLESRLHALDPTFAACPHDAPATVQLDLIIDAKGTLGIAKVVGPLAHTPTGDCLESAVRTARFPKFHGAPLRYIWPVELH